MVVLVIIIITFMALAAIEFGGDGGNYLAFMQTEVLSTKTAPSSSMVSSSSQAVFSYVRTGAGTPPGVNAGFGGLPTSVVRRDHPCELKGP